MPKSALRTHGKDELARLRKQNSALRKELAAMAQILRVISSSPTDALPVFRTIVQSAVVLCRSLFANLFLFDGEYLHYAATHSTGPDIEQLLRSKYPMRPDASQVSGRVLLDRSVVRLLDVRADPDYDRRVGESMGWTWRMLGVPMLREDRPLGAIVVGWAEAGPITKAQEELLKAFADQAVIALENVRLFEKLEEKSRQLDLANTYKTRFLSAASHDLRQPLHALNLYVGQLQSEDDPAERGRLVAQVDATLGAINELFNALLDMSSLETGALVPEVTEFPADALLRRVETTFDKAAGDKGLALRITRSAAWIRTDFVLLERILFNLVSNAVRYTARGGVLVGCRRRGTSLRFEVWDSGPGVPEDQQQSIFGEFYRIAAPERDGRGGLGLGLAIVDRLCRLLGHAVEVRSRPGSGSRFAVVVPQAAERRATPEAPPASAMPFDPVRGKVIVVIDDDALALDSMRGLLRSWNCVVATAASGQEALARLSALGQTPDVIVADDRLAGGKTGIEAVELLRSRLGAEIPAFLVSGDTAPERTQEARASGLLLLHKPVPPMALRNALHRFLRARDAGA